MAAKTQKKKPPSAKQLAARRRFAEMARSGLLKKKQTRRRNQLGAAIIGGLGSALGGKLVDDLEDKKPAAPARQKNFSFAGLFGKKKKRTGGRTQKGRKVAPKKKRTLSRGDYNKLYRAHFGAARKKALAEISPARFGRNPKGEHVPGLAPRYQKLYEDIVTSPAAKREYGARVKEVAARTARKVAAEGVNPESFRQQNPFFFGFKKYKGSVSHSGRRGAGRMTFSAFTKRGLKRKKKRASRKLKGLFNPQPGVFEEFRGRSPQRVSTAKGHGRDGSVIHVDELGKLREMTVGDKDISFGTSARLVAGPDKRLRIAGVRFKKTGKTHDCGEVDWIVYKADKPHHGKPKPLEWEHPFGEEGGRKPHLMIDPEGYPYLRGGDYKIESAGIID